MKCPEQLAIICLKGIHYSISIFVPPTQVHNSISSRESPGRGGPEQLAVIGLQDSETHVCQNVDMPQLDFYVSYTRRRQMQRPQLATVLCMKRGELNRRASE